MVKSNVNNPGGRIMHIRERCSFIFENSPLKIYKNEKDFNFRGTCSYYT